MRSRKRQTLQRRTAEHWKAVQAKLELYARLKQTLPPKMKALRSEIEDLRIEQSSALAAFKRALECLREKVEVKRKEVERAAKDFPPSFTMSKSKKTTWRYASPQERSAQNVLDVAKRKCDAMAAEEFQIHDASSAEGKALQSKNREIKDKADAIVALEKQLSDAKLPPHPVYQPLPDSRKNDSRDTLAVLFYTRADLVQNMHLLQQFCCVAQLSVCAWPLQHGSIWDV